MRSFLCLSLALCLIHHALRGYLFLPATIPFTASVHATNASAELHVENVSCTETPSVSADVQASQNVSNTREWPITDFKPLDNPPKHFAVDIDDTFLAYSPTAMKRNLDAFEKALKAGYNVFFCTGRPYISALAVLDDAFMRSTGYKGYPGVYHNGGVVYDSNGNVLRLSSFGDSFLSQFCDYVIEKSVEKKVVFCDMLETYMLCDDSSLMRPVLATIDIFSAPTMVTRDSLLKKKISLLIVYDSAILTNQTNLKRDVDYVMKESSFFGAWDVTPCGVTKAQGLKVLLDSYDVSTDNCGFIGNGTNDIEAMQMVEHSFAVGNAEVAVKAAAKHVVQQTCESGAFATVMNAVYGINEE